MTVHKSDIIIAAIVGGALGAAAALYLSPKSGRQLKDDIASVDSFKTLLTEEKGFLFPEKRTKFVGNPLVWGGVGGTLLGAVTSLLLAPKPGSDIRHLISDTYQQVADITQDLVNSFNVKSQEIAHIAGNQASDWSTKALDLAEGLVSEAKNWAEIVESAAIKAKNQALKMKDDPHLHNKFAEIMEWAHKAESMAGNVLKEMREWAQSIRRAAERVDTTISNLQHNNGNSNGNHSAISDVMEWAAVGIDIWQKMRSKR